MTGQSDIERALTIFQEFGPNRIIPVRKRWRDAFPGATEAELGMGSEVPRDGAFRV